MFMNFKIMGSLPSFLPSFSVLLFSSDKRFLHFSMQRCTTVRSARTWYLHPRTGPLSAAGEGWRCWHRERSPLSVPAASWEVVCRTGCMLLSQNLNEVKWKRGTGLLHAPRGKSITDNVRRENLTQGDKTCEKNPDNKTSKGIDIGNKRECIEFHR